MRTTAVNSSDKGLISVTGRGVASAIADTAHVDLTISVTEPAAAAARKRAAETANAVLDVIEKLPGISEDDVATSAIHVSPDYHYDNTNNKREITGYTFSNSIGVTIKDVSEAAVGTLLEAVVEAGQNSLSIDRVTFSLSSDHSYELTVEARKQASLDALQTAKQYAENFGLAVGGVHSIRDSSAGATPLPRHGAKKKLMSRTAASSGATPVAAGRIEVSADISVEFEVISLPASSWKMGRWLGWSH